jgi:hypothetical protein
MAMSPWFWPQYSVLLALSVQAAYRGSGDAAFAQSSSIISQLQRDTSTSYHILLRNLYQTTNARYAQKLWRSVDADLRKEGFTLVESELRQHFRSYQYRAKRNAYTFPKGNPVDVYATLTAELEAGGQGRHSGSPGKLLTVEAGFVANINLPYAELMKQGRYPKGSALDQVTRE